MGYLKRLALAWSGTFLIFVLYTFAANGLGFTWEELGLLLLVAGGLSLVSGAVAAAVIRKNAAPMLLVSQVLIILIVGLVWNR